MNDRFNLEQTYFQAKRAYYEGQPIMSDDEFDMLESQLLSMGSDAPYVVGADDRKAKYSHPSPMLSLAKYQATPSGVPPVEATVNWMNKFNYPVFEVTPKYDGNAANAIYVDGKLVQVLSRGNGTKGRDITPKIKKNIPETIEITSGTVEIRGEIVIKVSTFNQKYSEFKNPRNFVAGILNRDEMDEDILNDLHFIPLEVRVHEDNELKYLNLYPTIKEFANQPYVMKIELTDFESAYLQMFQYRNHTCEYQLDGFVIKTDPQIRPLWGENSHDPNWAIAIKFPPKEAITTVKEISWQYGKTGEVTPVAVMEPVDLDGSTVSRAALFNWGYLNAKKAFPGAQVAVSKSGDIIPQITRIIQPSNQEGFSHPTHCKCGSELKLEGIHLMCINPECEIKNWNKFYVGCCHLGIDGLGHAFAKQLWNAGFKNPLQILNPNLFNKKSLIDTGFFKEGKIVDNVIKEVQKIKELRPLDIVLMMGIDGMGYSTASQLGLYLSDMPHNFSGLEKSVISGFEPGGKKRKQYDEMLNEVSSYINIILPEKIAADSIPAEFTGSPKTAGFKTKEEFLSFIKTKGYHHTGLKTAKVLFTDDLNSQSAKMKTAKEKGIKIILYTDI